MEANDVGGGGEKEVENVEEHGSRSYRCNKLFWLLLLMILPCHCAMVPGLFMALFGSLLCSLTVVVFPPICFSKIKKTATFEIVLCITIMGTGIVCAALGTYSSLSQIVKSFT